jgi:hypothetical protein
VENLVVPKPDYVRFATHYRFRHGSCEAADPESKGIVENLVGYAKHELMVPLELHHANGVELAAANAAAATWCEEVNAATHSEVCAVPAERLVTEQQLLGMTVDVWVKEHTRRLQVVEPVTGEVAPAQAGRAWGYQHRR